MNEKQQQPVEQTGLLHQIEQETDESLHPLLQKLVDNIKIIGLILLLLLGGIGGYAWHQNNQEIKKEAALEKLGQIAMLTDQDKKIEELNAFLETAPASLETAIRLELISTYQFQKKHEMSLNQWEKLATSTDSAVKTLALLGQANAQVQLNKFDQALQTLEQAKNTAGKHYTIIITNELASVAEMAEKWEKALGAYEELKTNVHIANTDFIDYKINQIKKRIKS